MDFHAIHGGWRAIGHRSCYSATVQRTSGTFNFSAVFARKSAPTRWLAMTWFANFIAASIAAFQEKLTMLEFFIFAGGYAASVYSWPQIRVSAIGFSAEINQLRARAKLLEDQLREAAKGGV
jgi:hypothetical protein